MLNPLTFEESSRKNNTQNHDLDPETSSIIPTTFLDLLGGSLLPVRKLGVFTPIAPFSDLVVDQDTKIWLELVHA